ALRAGVDRGFAERIATEFCIWFAHDCRLHQSFQVPAPYIRKSGSRGNIRRTAAREEARVSGERASIASSFSAIVFSGPRSALKYLRAPLSPSRRPSQSCGPSPRLFLPRLPLLLPRG